MKKLLLLGLALNCVSLAHAQTPSTPPNAAFEAAMNSARTSFEMGDFAGARAKIEAALPLAKTTKQQFLVLRRLGVTYAEEKRLELAREQWRKALTLKDLEPDDRSELQLNIGITYSDEGNLALTQRELLPLLQNSKDESEKITLRMILAAAAANAKDYTEAKNQLNQVVHSESANTSQQALALIQLGNIEIETKHYPAARAIFEQLRQVKGGGLSEQVAAQQGITRSYNDAGDTEMLNQERPKEIVLWLQFAEASTKEKKWDQARYAYEQITALQPGNTALNAMMSNLIGGIYEKSNDWAKAREQYQIVLNTKATPDMDAKAVSSLQTLQQQAALGLGKSLIEEKKYPQARATLEKLLQTAGLNDVFKGMVNDQLDKLHELEKVAP